MEEKGKTAELIICLFAEWNAQRIPYAILRNYEDLPHQVGNDIDVLIDVTRVGEAELLLLRVAERAGFKCHNRVRFACTAVYLYCKENGEQIHFDLFTEITWRGFYYAQAEDVLTRCRPYKMFWIPNPEDEGLISMMTRLVYSGYVKEAYRKRIQAIAKERQEGFVGVLIPIVGKRLAHRLVEGAVHGDWKAVEGKYCSIRFQLIVRQLIGHPSLVVRHILSDLKRYIQRWMRVPGLCIVFCGPDGCGKTSVAKQLKHELVKTFSLGKGVHLHWKPALLKKDKYSEGPVIDPHGESTRNVFLSLLYFGFHWLEFVIGWWVRIKLALFRNGLVIIERYYYDFFIDQRRYRLNLPLWIIRLGFLFVKKPDLIFYLDAPPEVLQTRKQEVSFEETTRQREAYRELVSKLPNGHIIDAPQPLEKVVSDVEFIILDYMATRTAKRMV